MRDAKTPTPGPWECSEAKANDRVIRRYVYDAASQLAQRETQWDSKSPADVRQELARDWWLRRQDQVQGVAWEFSPSEVTGLGGPTTPLLKMLQKLRFDVRITQ